MSITFGVSGTHSTGKTTLVNALEAALIDRGVRVGRVESHAREAQSLGFPILREHTFESTLWIMSRGISERLEVGLTADVVLVDRPALDALGYLFAALEVRQEVLRLGQQEYLLELARHDAGTFDVLCRTALEPNIPIGPGRDSDLGFREAVGRHVHEVFIRLALSPRVVVAGKTFVDELTSELVEALKR